MNNIDLIKKLLSELEMELKVLKLWASERPTLNALTSQQPFCCDTLRFEQWLQFIFIPKISEMIAVNASLPSTISLCPMAEESYKTLGTQAAKLINVIGDIDEVLSGRRYQTLFVK